MTSRSVEITEAVTPSGRRIRQQRRGVYFWVLLSLLAVIGLLSVLAPVFSPYSPTKPSSDLLLPPSSAHWFGTDQLGFDVFSRTLWGGRSALLSASLAVGMATVAGAALGLAAGYGTRLLSMLIMRAMDILLGFPALLLALLLVATAGASLLSLSVAISIAFVPIFTRIVYSSSLSIRAEGYVMSARVSGTPTVVIMIRHILPGVRSELVVVMTSSFGWALLLSSTLSFLGLGVKPPAPDWGSDLSTGQSYLIDAWWMSVAPGVAITVCVLLVNLLGDQLSQTSIRSQQTRPIAGPELGEAL